MVNRGTFEHGNGKTGGRRGGKPTNQGREGREKEKEGTTGKGNKRITYLHTLSLSIPPPQKHPTEVSLEFEKVVVEIEATAERDRAEKTTCSAASISLIVAKTT